MGVGVEGHSSFGASFIFASSNTTSNESPPLRVWVWRGIQVLELPLSSPPLIQPQMRVLLASPATLHSPQKQRLTVSQLQASSLLVSSTLPCVFPLCRLR